MKGCDEFLLFQCLEPNMKLVWRCRLYTSLLLLVFLRRACAEKPNCDFGIQKLWSSKLRDTPLTAPPLLFDIDGDGFDDVLVPSFSGEVWGVHGENGHIVDNWPFYLEERSFHAGALVCDVNKDGVLEFLLATTDAEIVFVETDNTLLHGETIKISPLRVLRKWHQEESQGIDKVSDQTLEEVVLIHKPSSPPPFKSTSNFTSPFSEFESRFGRHVDPLYSRHETAPRQTGIDPFDQNFVYVDPHILATPTIADTDGDGVYAELVVSVSYYFDPHHYGDPANLAKLNGLPLNELLDFTAGGVVIIDLHSGKVKGQKLLSLTRGTDSQPGYLLATPTVVRLNAKEDPVIIVGLATGKLHMLNAGTLKEIQGFPLQLDSMAAQVAVGNLFSSESLELVVGDYSGIVYCIDSKGRRIWEKEVDQAISSAVRLVDIEGDGITEVVFATQKGDVWVLNGQTGETHEPSRYPIHLNSGVETSVLIMHLNYRGSDSLPTLGIIVPTADSIYIVDASTGCINSIQSNNVFHEVVSGNIDPYNPGLEMLALGLDGTLACFTTRTSAKWVEEEAWSGEAMGQSIFTHKSSSFHFALPFANTSREVTGKTFDISFTLISNNFQVDRSFSIFVSIGRKFNLYQGTVHAKQRETEVSLSVATPPNPLHAFMTVRVCNQHMQCRTQSVNVRFNLHFEDNLKWFLCLPFLSLCALILWLHREEGSQTLPVHTTTRKNL